MPNHRLLLGLEVTKTGALENDLESQRTGLQGFFYIYL